MNSHIALLAPVPLEHLESGLETCGREGRAAYGSDNGMCMAELVNALDGETCPVLFYASHAHEPGPPKVTWTGTFIKLTEARSGRHPEHERLRPRTTDGDGAWTVFYEVSDLKRLDPSEMMLVSSLKSEKGKPLSKTLVPLGPLLIENPY